MPASGESGAERGLMQEFYSLFSCPGTGIPAVPSDAGNGLIAPEQAPSPDSGKPPGMPYMTG